MIETMFAIVIFLILLMIILFSFGLIGAMLNTMFDINIGQTIKNMFRKGC